MLNAYYYSNGIHRCIVPLLNDISVNTLHATLRLCLRITRNAEHASTFAQLGGVKRLLRVHECDSTFTGFNGLATLIMRHIMETDENTLKCVMEKVCL